MNHERLAQRVGQVIEIMRRRGVGLKPMTRLKGIETCAPMRAECDLGWLKPMTRLKGIETKTICTTVARDINR